MDRLALRTPAKAVEICYERSLEVHLTNLFRIADQSSNSYVCARCRTPLNWIHFITLYETMMKSTRSGVLAAEGIYSHQLWEMENGTVLEYSGADCVRVSHDTEASTVTFKHDAGEVDVFLRTNCPEVETCGLDVRKLQPKSVTLQQKWRFTYRDTYIYTLVKCSVGKTRADACLATERYYWELAINPTQAQITRDFVSKRNAKFLAKIDDLVGRYERRL